MATNRKALRVYLTEEQLEALSNVVYQRGYESASQLVAEILIEACGLPGNAPQRGKYSRHEKFVHTDDNPVVERVQKAWMDGWESGRLNEKHGFAPVPYEDDNLMTPESLKRLRAQQSGVQEDEHD